ncbi:hypothetical protein [Flagellimonas sp. 2504JD1-5]
MKKISLFVALAGLIFVGCSKDDGPSAKCDSCTIASEKVEFCDNSNGTYTVKSGGEEETYTSAELEASGLTFAELKELTCSLSL